MKLQLQELISKIFNDERARAEFMSNPDSIISRFELSKAEKRAVLKTHAKLGLVSSDSAHLEAAVGPTIEWLAPTP